MLRYEFSMIKISPDMVRGEVFNIGLIVFKPNGTDVRLTNSLNKIRMLGNEFCEKNLNKVAEDIRWVSSNVEEPKDICSFFREQIIISDPGFFTVQNADEYERKVHELLVNYIDPEKVASKHYRKRITTNLKQKFIEYGIFGEDQGDIKNHKVIPSYPIAADEGLYADFLLKNGSYHLTETLDLRTDNKKVKLGEAALKALTIDKARITLRGGVQSTLIFAVDNLAQEKTKIHQLNILRDRVQNSYNLNSKQDMSEYFDYMLSKAGSNTSFYSS